MPRPWSPRTDAGAIRVPRLTWTRSVTSVAAMSETASRAGQPAPDFDLPAINREGRISLGNYRGRSAVLIGLYRGLHCPFCRRQIFMLGRSHQALLDTGV